MTLRARNLATGMALVMLAGALAGCDSGPKVVPVKGTVTVNGKATPGLQVDFVPKDPKAGTSATGFTGPDGVYTLHYPGNRKGAPAGDYTVRITVAETDKPADPKVEIPPNYNDKSELTAKVEAGKTQYDFQLTTP